MTPEPLPIPHNGKKPDWLEGDAAIMLGEGPSTDAASNWSWSHSNTYSLPVDHWAYPVLKVFHESGGHQWWTPWNPLLQAGKAPADWNGVGKIMFKGGKIRGSDAGTIWKLDWRYHSIVGYLPMTEHPGWLCDEPSPATPADADLVERWPGYTKQSWQQRFMHLDGQLRIAEEKFMQRYLAHATELQSLRDKLRVAERRERDRIIAWLEDTNFGDDDLDMASIAIANRIARGEHSTATIRSADNG